MGDAGVPSLQALPNSIPSSTASSGLPPLQPLPTPKLSIISDGMLLLEPLSRRGNGPGLIVLAPGTDSADASISINSGVPNLLIKWAEEGFTTIQIQKSALESNSSALQLAIEALKSCSKCDQGKIGLISYDIALWKLVESTISSFSEIAGVVLYAEASDGLSKSSPPCVQHHAGKAGSKLPRTSNLTGYEYPTAKSQYFASPNNPDFDYALEAVSHTRNLTFLKRHDIVAGPIFDLEHIWDEHTYFEFENRSVEHTMATMVQEPYVNHIPTITGGIGRKDLTEFYMHHFIFSNPDDTELELISRTVGVDRVVDEFIYKFTHDRSIDWLIPGVPPTNVYVEIPMMAVVNIRGDRLYHEHIMWDQATVLRQVGVLPDYLPWTHEIPDAKYVAEAKGLKVSSGSTLEVQVPAAGNETALKMRDKNSVPSNGMFAFKMRSS